MKKCLCVIAVVVMLFAIVVLYGNGNKASADDALVVHREAEFPPMMATVSSSATFTSYLYLPLVAIVAAPEYLFVESWINDYRGSYCSALMIDFPGYHFDAQQGVLTVYMGPVLAWDDLGYLGYGVSFSGNGGGVSSDLTPFRQVPVSVGGVTIQSVEGDGTVSLTVDGEIIVLPPGDQWIRQTVVADQFEVRCMITRTHRIMNYAFQERRKIEYW